MLVLAKSKKGAEFLYDSRSARKVSKNSCETIMRVLNGMKWNLKEGETWYPHEVDQYNNAFYYAERQSFTIRKGIVSARNY